MRAADGTYTALVDHQSPETFAAMHLTKVAALVHARLGHVQTEPMATPYEVVSDFAKSGSCCGGDGGHGGHAEHDRAVAGGRVKPQVAGRYCQGT